MRAEDLKQFASTVTNAEYQAQDGQGYVVNKGEDAGDVIFEVAGQVRNLTGFDVGGRFLDLRNGIAPNKFTAEIRHVTPWPAHPKGPGTASIAWSPTAMARGQHCGRTIQS